MIVIKSRLFLSAEVSFLTETIVCTENSIRIDWPKESPNVNAP